MLALKKNGRRGAFFSAVLRRRHDVSTKAWGTEPLGYILRQQRESRQLSLSEAARVTGIPPKYLLLLERASEEQVWGEPLALIAYVQRYAEFLHLNPDSTLARFIAELEQVAPREAASGASRTQSLKPLPAPRSQRGPQALLPLVALGLLACIVAYSTLRVEQRSNGDQSTSLRPPAASPAPQSGIPSPAPSPTSSSSPPEVGQPQAPAPSPAGSPPVAVALQADPVAATPQGQSPLVRSDPQLPQPSRELPPQLHLSGAAVNNTEVTDGAAKEQVQDFGEARQRAAQGTALPKVEEEPSQGSQIAVPDRDTRHAETTRRRESPARHRPPHIVAAAPTAQALEVTAGEVQRFAVQATAPEQDTRLAYTWLLDGQQVARGPTWEFRVPPASPAAPGYQVQVEVSDSRGKKARVTWQLAVTPPSPLPRIVEAQPRDRKVVIAAGEVVEFSVVVAMAGGAQEATQGLRYQWQVDDTPPQTTQTASFRFVDPTPTLHRVTVFALSPQGFKSTPKGWLVEVRPADVPPPPPEGATPAPGQNETNTPLAHAAAGANRRESGTVRPPVAPGQAPEADSSGILATSPQLGP